MPMQSSRPTPLPECRQCAGPTLPALACSDDQVVREHIGRWIIEHGASPGTTAEAFGAFIDPVGVHRISAAQDLELETLLTGVPLEAAAPLRHRRLTPSLGRSRGPLRLHSGKRCRAE